MNGEGKASQGDPPWPEEGFTPVMMRYWYKLWAWLKSWRVVQGDNVQITDAPGGGKLISVAFPTNLATVGNWQLQLSGTKAVVVKNPTLQMTADLMSAATISGISNPQTLTEGQLLFLQMTHDAGSGEVASISLVADDEWTEYPVPYSTTGSGTFSDPLVISMSYLLLGYARKPGDAPADAEGPTITLDDGTQLKVVRCCFSPLEFKRKNIGGGFIIPFPECSNRGGPTT